MDCRTYIEEYLSAHVDGELSDAELRAAEEHLAGCVNCRARFAEERAVKALLRERAELRRTPPIVRGSILAALDAIDQTGASGNGRDRAAGADRAGLLSIRRARVWLPAAMAAVALFAFIMMHAGNPQQAHAFSPFDVAIDNYKQFADHFEPNIKSTAPADISDAFMERKLPGFVWNFQRVGYKLVGGRVDRLSDGTPVSYTFYRGQSGTILCTYMKSHGLQPPPGEAPQPDEPGYTIEHHYYNYKGYNVCLSYPRSGCICILVTRRPMQEFVEAVIDSGP
jgi:hypothetical protein